MQDNLAKKLQEPYAKPDLKVHDNPHAERIAVIRSTIDALYDIRLSLSVKKILGPVIKRSELERMVEKTKEKYTNQKVKDEIDKALGEYLGKGKNVNNAAIPSGKDIWDNNKPIMKSNLENKIDEAVESKKLSLNEMEDYLQAGRGNPKVKTTRYFKNSDDKRTS